MSILLKPRPDELAVFTHGDVFLSNIMVDKDPAKEGTTLLLASLIGRKAGFILPGLRRPSSFIPSTRVVVPMNEGVGGCTSRVASFLPVPQLNGLLGGYGTRQTVFVANN